MRQSVMVIGAGINGLVAANYLQRNGFQVTLLEQKPAVGGACAVDTLELAGKTYEYPSGATVLGFMQDFVFAETGLKERLSVHAPCHPRIVYFTSQDQPCLMHNDVQLLAPEVAEKWGERGDLAAYSGDLDRVVQFLVSGYRSGVVPTVEQATRELGDELVARWITGSAKDLLNHYLTSDKMKVYQAIDVTESGPVSIESPYSAFTLPLMASGTIFGGDWGFVRGGLWKLTEELAEINRDLGVNVVTSAQVQNVSDRDMTVTYRAGGAIHTAGCDHIIFATDPLSASRLIQDENLLQTVASKKTLGTSGKLVMLFRNPIVWKDDTGLEDFDTAFRFMVAVDDLHQFEAATQAVVSGERDFLPGYFEIYCEGAGMRKLGLDRGYESLTVFFKNLAFLKNGDQLPAVRDAVASLILSYIENDPDLIATILLTPRDLHQKFFFPAGNIDHIELCEGQTYFARNFSSDPRTRFYQFGGNGRISYCGAGSYPCGSIAGTPGVMCASDLIKSAQPMRSSVQQ